MTLTEIIANANGNSEFIPGMSSNELFYGTSTDDRLTDVIADVAEAVLDKADEDHTHEGYAPANHSHTGYAPADHIHNYAAPTHSHTQSEINGLASTLAGKADLENGMVPAHQLPSYVDDVIEGTLSNETSFYERISDDATDTVRIIPESGKVYVDTNTNKSYRWSGTRFVEINCGIALGETSATAYRGDRGKTAYDHSQDSTVHVTAAQKASWDAKAAQAITAHMAATYYAAPAGDTYTTIPLTSSVVTGDALTIVNNQIRIGAGISKVMISAQLCVGSSNISDNKFIAIRKNTNTQLARAQMKLCENTTPQTMAIPSILVSVAEGDLLTLDFYGKKDDTIYGGIVLTYLTVQKIA